MSKTVTIEDAFKTSVYKIEITLNQNKNPAQSDKVMLSAVTNWIQKELENTSKKQQERHGPDSGFSFSISYSEINKINLDETD